MPEENLDTLDTSDLDNEIEDAPISDIPTAEGSPEGEEPEGEAETPEVPEPQATQEQQDFLRDGDDIVYKTREDAVQAHRYKNDVISRMRNQLISQTGIDPLTGKQVQQTGSQVQQQHIRQQNQPQAQAPQEHDPVNDWMSNPDNYFVEAAKNPVAANLALVDHHFQKFVAPVMSDLLDAMTEMQLEIAVSRFAGQKHKVKNEQGQDVETLLNDGFNEFIATGGMEKVLQENPMLLQQLQDAKFNRKWKSFPEILRSAFGIYKGTKTPDLVKQAAAKATAKVAEQINKNKRAVTVKAVNSKASKPKDELKELEERLGNVRLDSSF